MPTSFREGSSSGSLSRGRSPTSRASSFSTSRSALSTPRSASSSGAASRDPARAEGHRDPRHARSGRGVRARGSDRSDRPGRLLEVGTGRPSTRVPSLSSSRPSRRGDRSGGAVRRGTRALRDDEPSDPADLPHQEGGPVRLLVRPEQVLLQEEAGNGESVRPRLGRASILEQTFAGGVRRVRVRLAAEEAVGVRQIFPAAPYGEEGVLVRRRCVPAQRAFSGGHVTSGVAVPRSSRSREFPDGGRPPETLAGAERIARNLGGPGDPRDREGARRGGAGPARISARAGAAEGTEGHEVRVRAGEAEDQIATELAEAWYDLFVADGEPCAGRRGAARPRGGAAREVADARSLPPWPGAAPPQHPRLHRGGELRTRSAVRFGGWLAARLKARVALLHVFKTGRSRPTGSARTSTAGCGR